MMISRYEKQATRACWRARRRGLQADLSANEWADTIEDFNALCAYCDQPYWTLDHFVPLAKDGPSTIGNCIPCCDECNRLKGSLAPEHFYFVSKKRIKQIRLYLRRRQEGLRGWPPPLEQTSYEKKCVEPVIYEEPRIVPQAQEGVSMYTPALWKQYSLASGHKLLITTNAGQIVLQLHSSTGDENDLLRSSFQVSASLTPTEALAIAQELLSAATPYLEVKQEAEQSDEMNRYSLGRPTHRS